MEDDLLHWIGPGESLFSKSGDYRESYWGSGENGEEHAAITATLERIARQRRAAGWPKWWWLDEGFCPAKCETPVHLFQR